MLLTAADASATPVPGTDYTFSTLKQAQALGDFDALVADGRDVVHYHLEDPQPISPDVSKTLRLDDLDVARNLVDAAPIALRCAALAAPLASGGALVAAASPRRRQRQAHARLFPPDQLGLLEAPDRDEWQQPDRIMDALGIAERLARGRPRRRRRLVHDPPRPPRRAERARLRRRHPAADDRGDQAPREDATA